MNSTGISALVICMNSEGTIARCLASLDWADEIILVDGGSTDRTLEIARDCRASWISKLRLFEEPWRGFRFQRNFALSQSRFDWIFSIDSDEACSESLRTRLNEISKTWRSGQPRYFKVHRREYFLGKPIRYGIWNPSYQDRFFLKGQVEYVNEIHEYAKYPEAPARIHESIEHWPDFRADIFLTKMNRYTTIEAQNRFDDGYRTNWFRILFAFPAMFLKNYFYYKAYRDGIHGLVISVLEGISRAVRHIKIWQLQTRERLK